MASPIRRCRGSRRRAKWRAISRRCRPSFPVDRGHDHESNSRSPRRAGRAEWLRQDPARALATTSEEDVALLYWTAASWGALIGLSKNDPAMLAELPQVEALMDRALALDEGFDRGAIHTFMIGYESVRQGI